MKSENVLCLLIQYKWLWICLSILGECYSLMIIYKNVYGLLM